MNFSVLMSVYVQDNPKYLYRALESIYDNQDVKPTEIVLVEDGELTDELYAVIGEWKDRLSNKLITISLPKNVGLGDALNHGLNFCNYDIVARMDADDVSVPSRFQSQISIMKDGGIDICGSFVDEFDDSEQHILSVRRVPLTNAEIIKFAKLRSPLNHVTVMFNKNVVQGVGGYQKMFFFEDYYLWIKLIMANASFYNIPESLVKVRGGRTQLKRRKGIVYFKYEFQFLMSIYRLSFLNKKELVLNIIIRFLVRMMPMIVIKKVYSLLRSKP